MTNAVKRDAMAGNSMDIMVITQEKVETQRLPLVDLGE